MAEPSSSTAITTSSTTSPSSSSQCLRGLRPAPLRVRRDSLKIRKPAVQQVRRPVIIYTVSPKVVHAEPSEFMSVVQRLTGAAPSSLPPPPPLAETTLPFPFFGGHHIPPSAPQLQFPFQLHHQQAGLSPAAIHQQAARNATGVVGADDVGGLPPPLPSILSPVPGSLPAVPPSFFSPPGGAGGGINLFRELISPAFLGATTTTGATSQIYPTTLPSPLSGGAYYWDLFNNHPHQNNL